MISVIILCLCFSKHIHSKTIIVNNNGNDSITCCANGGCFCNSLWDALYYIENNTIINITSESVLLEDNVCTACNKSGYVPINNVTVTGNNVVVRCNNKGGMFWKSGNNISIEGITWDQCGNPNRTITPAIQFDHVYYISFVRCTFQYSKVCRTVDLILYDGNDISIHVINSSFISNKLEVATECSGGYGSLVIRYLLKESIEILNIVISRTTFQYNGNPDEHNIEKKGAALYCDMYIPLTLNVSIEHSIFSSNEILGMFLHNNITSKMTFNNLTTFNNSNGGFTIISGSGTMLDIISSYFIENNNGALIIEMDKDTVLSFSKDTFLRNKGYISHGVAMSIDANSNTTICLHHCTFDHNIANGEDSIVYITAEGLNPLFGRDVIVSACSSSFVNNELGSALHISQVTLVFYNSTFFQNNSAESGAAIYAEQNSLITVTDKSFIQFLNNTVLLRGGAIYSDLTNCINNGILFSNFSNFSSIEFTNNAAGISGNSIYFNIPKSCNVQRNYTKNDSVAYIPYKLKYTQSHDINGPPIAASPYSISLCTPHKCNFIPVNQSCLITEKKMLGQLVYFNATVCDYFSAIAETVQFQIKCINCGTKYRVLNNELLVNNVSPNKISILSMNAPHDVVNNTNILLEVSSVLSDNDNKFSAELSLTLTTCYNGFLFSAVSQNCECYNSGNDNIVQCQDDRAEIKLGYWSGIIFQKRIISLCPINYCDFNHRTETRNNYYTLPKVVDDQCSLHRTGAVCSVCKLGYTLAYDSIDCVNIDHCSPGMTVLVIALTFLYWIIIVAVLFVLTYYCGTQVSSGYFIGVIYFYSIVDIMLASNLYVMDGLFYAVTILSSFAKLTPQFLGRLCFVKGLDTIDQQFIHYVHTVCILFILIGITLIAKCFKKLAFYVNRCIAHVTFLFLLLSYTSITSTSLQLLRGVQYDNNDGVFVYLSPHIKYFTHRHAAYGTVALLCGLLITIGLPLSLLVEPCLRKKTIFQNFKPVLDQFQDSYKDSCKWFAANYLLCRLVIMLIAYFGNSDHDNMVYYTQTACVIIVMNHVLFWPYKKHLLNVLDAAILLTMLLVVNLNNFDFSKTAMTGLTYTLLIIPLLLLFGIGFAKLLIIIKMKIKGTPTTIQR